MWLRAGGDTSGTDGFAFRYARWDVLSSRGGVKGAGRSWSWLWKNRNSSCWIEWRNREAEEARWGWIIWVARVARCKDIA